MVDNGSIVLAGRYEVGELIGRGGMAEVHIGHDTRLGRTVAIKILRSDLARDPSFLARFRREAQAAASLNHPAIVAVYDTGEDVHTDSGGAEVHVPFIVMEYVEGHTVREILRDGQAVPIDEAIEITAGVLAALEYSHHAGIVHRDIKPANVMITPTGAVKVMDFGIARAIADSSATMTQTQAVIGTAQYLSPEQARGETVDARSDLYSTGCLLFELLTGRPPFIGDSPVAVAYQHVREMPPTPSSIAPDVPEVLDRITLKALAKERDHRYSSAAEFHADLENALRGGNVSAPAIAAGAALAGAALAADAQPTMIQSATQVMAETPSPWETTPVAIPPETPANGEDSEDEEPEKKSRRGLMWTLIAVGAVAIAAILAMLLLKPSGQEPAPKVAVPAISAGWTKQQAQEAIEAQGLIFKAAIDTEATGTPDTATGKTNPAVGTEVDKGTTVTVFFFGQPQSGLVPNVAGLSQEDARKAIEAQGFVWGSVQTEDSPTVAKGNVTKTEPGAGAQAEKGSTVIPFISSGTVTIRDFTGSSQADAERELTGLGLTPQSEEVESDLPPGTVIGQSPGAGPVAQGSTVKLQIAVAPPEPSPSPDDQTTVPNLVGMTADDAANELGNDQLQLGDQTLQNHPTIPKDRVIASTPRAGTSVPVGSEVDIVISLGPAAGKG